MKKSTILRLSLSFFIYHLTSLTIVTTRPIKRACWLSLLLLLSFSNVVAQDALWATGSAVPDGTTVQLTRRPDGKFTYTGPLNDGELKIMTTATPTAGTQYLTPQQADSYLVNYGLTYVLTTDANREGWYVSFQEDTYRFVVDTGKRTVTGELLLPWNELLIAGSAITDGANNVEWNRDNMLPFTRSHDNPYVFTWEGWLGHFDVVEPDRFKLEGQMTWGPRELHPYSQDEDILTSTQFRQGGDDTKWHVYQEGRYRITVDLFHETIRAEIIAGNRNENVQRSFSAGLPL